TTSVIELAKKFEDAGVAAIVYTDISRDGTGTGADFEGTKALAENVSIPIIASGGIGSIEDVEKITQLKINGVIIGRALYDKKIEIESLKAIG
ncbi:MAG: phosphoribosylformimino-5-aminoimidazole carboxamide ribotide isomerase, partial [Rickettsiales bacterium]